MTVKSLLTDVGKLILAGGVFAIGTLLGGMIASPLQLPVPKPPEGADMNTVSMYMMLTTPLLALGLAVVARGLRGSFVVRALVLALFIWIAYTVNTQLEATIVSTYAQGIWFALVVNSVAALLCGAVVAFLFPPEGASEGAAMTGNSFWASRNVTAWAWRLVAAAVVFMLIYFVFGLMVVPFTSEYYRQNMFGLVMPTIEQLLPILFTRSVLFLLACLPILVLWQKSNRALFWRLGLALFLLVGGVIMLYATWLPLYVRVPHTLEILADEFVYAGALVFLLRRAKASGYRVPKLDAKETMAGL